MVEAHRVYSRETFRAVEDELAQKAIVRQRDSLWEQTKRLHNRNLLSIAENTWAEGFLAQV